MRPRVAADMGIRGTCLYRVQPQSVTCVALSLRTFTRYAHAFTCFGIRNSWIGCHGAMICNPSDIFVVLVRNRRLIERCSMSKCVEYLHFKWTRWAGQVMLVASWSWKASRRYMCHVLGDLITDFTWSIEDSTGLRYVKPHFHSLSWYIQCSAHNTLVRDRH